MHSGVAGTALSAGGGQRIVIVFGLALLMACWLPYHFAVGGLPDNMSLAVAAGFDQHTAVLGIIGTLAIAGLWSATRRPLPVTPAGTANWPFSLDTGFAIMVTALFVVAGLLYLNGDDRYNEIWYFTDRKNLMALGGVPYRDFLANYGPVLIWAPYLLHLVLPGDWLLAYVIVDAGFLLVSLALIRALVAALPVPDHARGLIFLCLALFWLPLTYASGLHYSGIRFVVPVVLAFQSWRLRDAGLGRLCWQPIGATLVAGAISFEIGIVMAAFNIGALLFLALAQRRRQPLLALVVLVAVLAALVAALPPWFTAPLTANFSGREFPLVPNIFLLFVLFSLCVAALSGLPPLLRAAASGRLALSDADLGLCFIAVIALLLVPGAFGRADFVHMFAYGFGAVVVALCWAANAARPRRLLIYAGITIELVAMNHMLFLTPLMGDLRQGRIAQFFTGPGPSPASTGQVVRPEQLAGYPGVYDPFFVAVPSRLSRLGYYAGTGDVAGPLAIARKTAELDASRYYLLPTSLQRPPRGAPNAVLAFDRIVFAYVVKWPFPLPFTRPESASALSGFIDLAVGNCLPVDRVGTVIVCRNRDQRQ